MSRLVAAGILMLLLGGCAEILPVGPAPAVAEAGDGLFLLVVRSPADRYGAGQPVEVFAELVYQGPKNRETIYHAASPIGWQIAQLDGPAVMGGMMAAPCLSTELTRGLAKRYPFEKGGVVEDAPPFDRAWFEDQALRLPSGRWRIAATMSASLGDCGGEGHALEAAVVLAIDP